MVISVKTNSTPTFLPQPVNLLICALKHRDRHTQIHSQRVMKLATKLGRACHLSAIEIYHLQISACLHDIGKIGVPDHILFKPSQLNAEEWNCMKTHPEKGEEITRMLVIEDCDVIANIIRQHHESYDGTGYPDRLAGETISILSRIIAVADAYDAITETRPYARARSHQEAMEILNYEQGIKFDPYVFQKFIILIEKSN